MVREKYDVIVVGGGHAGCEAAMAAANLGSQVLLITMDITRIAQMSCNPSMGGIGKGQLIREIDALGGFSGIITDKTTIHFRMLNRSKGPAVWSPRAQNDRVLFSLEWRKTLESNPNIDILQDMVTSLIIQNYKCRGVITILGFKILSKAVILTNGTFLNGVIHIGDKKFEGGRIAEKKATGLTEFLVSLGFEAGRFKTGTPPRVDGRTLDYSKMEEQPSEYPPMPFSFLPVERFILHHKSCWITRTNPKVHDIIASAFDRSPLFTGQIKARGVRYCPSIEDKVAKFQNKQSHTIFVEPEGWNTYEVYVNGFSTSLPIDVQIKALREIPGFENARMLRPGYAIEYDYFPPTQLNPTLETKNIEYLFFAGQINGTTGYEEAASQGIIAGINAHLKINDKEPFILTREDAIIGVLINDLVTKGTDEPYRMFTARSEYRLSLRQDNADIRLTPKAYSIGLASPQRMKRLEEKIKNTNKALAFLAQTKITLNNTSNNEKVSLKNLLVRTDIDGEKLVTEYPLTQEFLEELNDPEAWYQAIVHAKYEHYINKEKEIASKFSNLEKIKIPPNINYDNIKALSFEAIEKLKKIKPINLREAANIPGISPADILVLLTYIR